jgi:hypothetical protein
MSRKVFTAGEVLAAADVNNFLMNQTVMSFAGTASRTASIGTPVEGMYTHLEDIDALEFWNGSAWTSASALHLVKTQTIGTSVTSVTVTNAFSSAYEDYLILISGGSSVGNSILGFRIGSQTSGYLMTYIYSNYNTSVAADSSTNATSIPYAGIVTANGINMNLKVEGPFLSKMTSFTSGVSGLGSSFLGSSVGYLNNTTSYTDFTILSGTNMTGGVIKVYGHRKA